MWQWRLTRVKRSSDAVSSFEACFSVNNREDDWVERSRDDRRKTGVFPSTFVISLFMIV